MKLLILAAYLTASTLATPSEWQFWKQINKKSYNKIEDSKRYQIFMKNKKLVLEHNKLYDQGKSILSWS